LEERNSTGNIECIVPLVVWKGATLKLVIIISLVPVYLLCSIGCKKEQPPVTEGQTMGLMRIYSKEGRFKDAIDLGMAWVNSNPDNAEMPLFIGHLYLDKAQTSRDKKEDLVEEGVKWVNRALELQQDLPVLTSAASAFEIAGDLGSQEKCYRYKKAANLIAQVIEVDNNYLTKKEGEQAKKWREIMRMDQDKLKAVSDKIMKSNCPS
jgi:tetratricopeptide (TPR) repeat protein